MVNVFSTFTQKFRFDLLISRTNNILVFLLHHTCFFSGISSKNRRISDNVFLILWRLPCPKGAPNNNDK